VVTQTETITMLWISKESVISLPVAWGRSLPGSHRANWTNGDAS